MDSASIIRGTKRPFALALHVCVMRRKENSTKYTQFRHILHIYSIFKIKVTYKNTVEAYSIKLNMI